MSSEFRIGDWQVHADSGVLLRSDERVQLEPKTMEVLIYLAGHPGVVLPKERLIQAVWPDTFVTDEVLTNAIWQLRKALGDDSRNPRYIETLSRRGYRLIATVEFVRPTSGGDPADSGKESAPQRRRHRNRSALLVTLVSLGAVGCLAIWHLLLRPNPRQLSSVKEVPFTHYSGSENRPDFSPQGDRIAFQWSGKDQNHPNWDIYIKQVGPGDPFRLTSDPRVDLCPRWSPDGLWVVFIRLFTGKTALVKIPALGGAETILKEIPMGDLLNRWPNDLSWFPDGRHLAVSFRPDGEAETRCFSLNMDDGRLEAITHPPKGILGDYYCQISPDGSSIAYFRRNGWAVWDLYQQSLPQGPERRLTFEHFQWASGLTWMPDATKIAFAAGGELQERLWWIDLKTEHPVLLMGSGENLIWQYPDASPRGGLLACAEGMPMQRNIWRIANPLVNPLQEKNSDCIISSTRTNDNPAFSPDGTKVAFGSLRTGYPEIFICNSDGSQMRQLTYLKTYAGAPVWSPDGRQICFDQWKEDADIYLVNAEGGLPRQIIRHPAVDVAPNWSRDGRWIYFASNRSGRYETWKVSVDGGEPIQVTQQGGYHAKESMDGTELYYTKSDMGEIWKMPVSGGMESRILEKSIGFDRWALTPTGIYFRFERAIYLLDLKSKKIQEVLTLQIPGNPATFTVSPDGRWFLCGITKPQDGTDIMLVENFH